ncbi:MAG: SDR family oxidoreductase [Alphaproteobacteria bacterium]|nr:SDR family oxidoreductase [Alphaproteobacteria bacterium]MBO6628031.1 SDR family oxidoreductase [Alphaproteobacteria bacterium]MDF1625602.1 SDR family NAD(P)-dependent oxidoreductase [Parvibaculaceae bacterium]
MTRLAGKSVIITGAGSGIGRASAMIFAREGANVVAVDRVEAAVDETADMVRSKGGTIKTVAADVGDELAVKGYVDFCLSAFGAIDAIYANAGISGGIVPIQDQTPTMWEEILRVNLIGPFLAIKHVSPHMMKKGKGSIICTASVAGLRANAGSTPYSASKAGVISLVQTAANQFYGTGIRVNAICPGLIETGMTAPIFEGARARGSEGKIGQLNPTARYGHPDEIANMALFLASDEASYVNGQAIPVCGGLSSTHPFAPSRRGA